MRKKMFGLMVVITTSLLLLGCSNPITQSQPATVINIATIEGVVAPKKGSTPVTAIKDTAQYTGTVAWSGKPTKFAAGTAYTAVITLTAKPGYTLKGVAANFFTVVGSTSSTNLMDSGVITAVFPATTPDPVINISSILGIKPPVTGAIPVTAIMETDQFTGTVVWSPAVSNMFVSNTVYTATITLSPKDDYTLNGVAANYFTVSEATTTNSSNSGVVSAVYSATTANLSAVSDVTSSSQLGIILKAVQGGSYKYETRDMTVSSLRMSQNEITKEQFEAVTGMIDSSPSFPGVINGPVNFVNWYHALVFCNNLSVADGLTPVYSIKGTTKTTAWGAVPWTSNASWNAVVADWSANGYRLPTEAEWIFAARGGNSSHNYTYAGSNTLDDVAWYKDNSQGTTHTVGTKATNELGLYDMSGNVSEWIWDWEGVYLATVLTDYRGADSGTYHKLYGGSWYSNAFSCSMNTRIGMFPDDSTDSCGFRIVRP